MAIVRGDTVITVETTGQVPAGMSAIELGISTPLPGLIDADKRPATPLSARP